MSSDRSYIASPASNDNPATGGSGSNGKFSTASYFSTQHPPPNLEEVIRPAKEFLARWKAVPGKKVVVITSGGTTVPLEANTVRFLDNFSAGTRGATSAEYFLARGYAVIFLHRQYSLRPFSRHYSHSMNPFLDLLDVTTDGQGIAVTSSQIPKLMPILEAYNATRREGSLLSIDFNTVNEYLWYLRSLSEAMATLGRRGMFYLAAAVSDFFLPLDRVAEHKIQSTRGNLTLEMDQVPKVLRPLVQEWIPEAFIVSFKLETDFNLLVPKAKTALLRYGHQALIANDLHHRKQWVILVERKETSTSSGVAGGDEEQRQAKDDGSSNGKEALDASRGSHSNGGGDDSTSADDFKETTLRVESLNHPDAEIEELIVDELVQRHDRWVAMSSS